MRVRLYLRVPGRDLRSDRPWARCGMSRPAMAWLLRAALAHVGRVNLRVTTARGVAYAFGDGSGAPIAVRFTSMAAQWAVLLDPDLKLGEAYMDGTFAVERGTIP